MDISGLMGINGLMSSNDARANAMQNNRHQVDIDRFTELLTQMLKDHEEGEEARRASIMKGAREFEAYFIHLMFREMRRTTFNEQGILPKSNAEKMFTDMLDEEVSKSVANGRGIGLADMIYRQMTKEFM